jgi:hypothetical protein
VKELLNWLVLKKKSVLSKNSFKLKEMKRRLASLRRKKLQRS